MLAIWRTPSSGHPHSPSTAAIRYLTRAISRWQASPIALNGEPFDSTAAEYGFMGMALAAAAKHKLVGLLGVVSPYEVFGMPTICTGS